MCDSANEDLISFWMIGFLCLLVARSIMNGGGKHRRFVFLGKTPKG